MVDDFDPHSRKILISLPLKMDLLLKKVLCLASLTTD